MATTNSATPWPEGPDHSDWRTVRVSQKILGQVQGPIPLEWARACARRLRRVRDRMRGTWVGLDGTALGPLTDWVVACSIARENCLLLGRPGVAKSEIAVQFFKWLGLTPPRIDPKKMGELASQRVFDMGWWDERAAVEREEQKYFHYLLSRFSQVEEVFGPIELDLLKKGVLTRVNFGLLTGPGVRAAFLDEVFKASSSVLNTLLTLTQERTYFNWGGMIPSDLVMFIAASNEMPGGFASGTAGLGAGGEDFQTLHAFLDRFPIRLEVPTASGTSHLPDEESDLEKAFAVALGREQNKFTCGTGFPTPPDPDPPCINDVLLLGRAALQGLQEGTPLLFDLDYVARFHLLFMEIARQLQAEAGTQGALLEHEGITWTISPRKLRSLFKIALAMAIVRDDIFTAEGSTAPLVWGPGPECLQAFGAIWDSPAAQRRLRSRLETTIHKAERELT